MSEQDEKDVAEAREALKEPGGKDLEEFKAELNRPLPAYCQLPPSPNCPATKEIDRLKAELLLKQSSCKIFEVMIKQYHAEIEALKAENEQLKAAGVGYSQQTVDALVAERDKLRKAISEALEVMDDEPARELLEQVLKGAE